jgi:hypothetical protein
MSSAPDAQLTLNFEPALPDRFRTLRDFIAHRIQVQAKPAKTIASDMDMSPSTLSRKLSPGDGDTQRFNIDDLEHYIHVTGDTAAIEYLAAKYLCSDQSRKVRALARVESLSAELSGLVASLKGAVQ